MKKFKNILNFVLIVALVFSSIAFSTYAVDYDGDGVDDDIIVDSSDDGGVVVNPVNPVEEVENEEDLTADSTSIFTDIPNEISAQVNLVVNLGIMSATGDKFEPDKEVTCEEFLQIVAGVQKSDNEASKQTLRDKYTSISQKALYNAADIITYKDAVALIVDIMQYKLISKEGYNSLLIANENKLLNGIGSDEMGNLKKSTAAKLAFNTLNAPMIALKGLRDGEIGYIKTTETPLEKYFNVFKSTGIVDGKYETTLQERNSGLPKNIVTIADVQFDIGKTAARLFLGYNVELFYKYNPDTDDIPILISIVPHKNDVLKVTYDSYRLTDNADIYFFEGDKEFKAVFDIGSTNSAVIQNGKRISLSAQNTLSSVLNSSDDFTLIDNNRDGKYDVALVNQYITLVVKDINEESKTLTLEIPYFEPNASYYSFKGFSEENNKKAVSYFRGTDEVGFSNIKQGDILSVSRSGGFSDELEVINVFISDKSVNGKVTEVFSEQGGEDLFLINNIEYKIGKGYKSYLNSVSKKLSVSEEGIFYLDHNNKIAFSKTSKTAGVQYGYLYKIGISKGLSKSAQAELLTMKNKFEIFDFADKIDLTYYPRYTPYAIYSSPTVPPVGAYQVLTGSYYGYLDPVVRRKISSDFKSAFELAYPNRATESDAAIAQKMYFQDGYGTSLRGSAGTLLDEYFNSNVDSTGHIIGNFVFDMEKMQLVRYTLDEKGRITGLETAKDYGMGYQWKHQNISEEERRQDIENDVFRLSVKANQFKIPILSITSGGVTHTTNNYTNLQVAYRNDVSSRAFMENVALTQPTGNNLTNMTALSNEAQNPLFFLDKTTYVFDVPLTNTVNSYYFDNTTTFTLEKLNRARLEKERYKVVKFNINESGSHLVNAYNTDINDVTNLMVRHFDLNPLGSAALRVLVDKVSTVIDKNGNTVQKLTAYKFDDGVLYGFFGSTDKTFNRNNAASDMDFSGPYKKGDIILIGKNWKDTAYYVSEPRWVYDGPDKFRLNNSVAGDALSSNSVRSNLVSLSGDNQIKWKLKSDFDIYKGFYLPDGVSKTNIYTGEFAGRVKETSNTLLKFDFTEQPLATSDASGAVPFSRINKAFSRRISSNVMVFEVNNGSIKPISIEDISPSDFVVGYVVKNVITQIVRYNEID